MCTRISSPILVDFIINMGREMGQNVIFWLHLVTQYVKIAATDDTSSGDRRKFFIEKSRSVLLLLTYRNELCFMFCERHRRGSTMLRQLQVL